MSIELGRIGIWRHPSGLGPELAAEVEALGYGAIWVGGSPDGDLAVVESLLGTPDPLPALRALAGYLQLTPA